MRDRRSTWVGTTLGRSIHLAWQRESQNLRGRRQIAGELLDLIKRTAQEQDPYQEQHQLTPEELEVLLPEMLDIFWAYNAHDIAIALCGVTEAAIRGFKAWCGPKRSLVERFWNA